MRRGRRQAVTGLLRRAHCAESRWSRTPFSHGATRVPAGSSLPPDRGCAVVNRSQNSMVTPSSELTSPTPFGPTRLRETTSPSPLGAADGRAGPGRPGGAGPAPPTAPAGSRPGRAAPAGVRPADREPGQRGGSWRRGGGARRRPGPAMPTGSACSFGQIAPGVEGAGDARFAWLDRRHMPGKPLAEPARSVGASRARAWIREVAHCLRPTPGDARRDSPPGSSGGGTRSPENRLPATGIRPHR